LAGLIQSSHQQGVLFFGAAGNSPTTAPTYPAAYPGVMAVTAVDRQGNLAPYANRGSFVDVAAPGASVVYYNGQSFFISGTSASTAFVSGSAAGIKAGGAAPAQVEAQLRERLGVPSQAVPKP
jgi:thermitase